jgi:predicted DNA-binding transcriptional regulator AlpA
MTLPENDQRPPRERRTPDLGALAMHDDKVLTFDEWCAFNGLSPRTGWRIIHGPDGPKVTMLSERRYGITIRNNRAWQQSKERAS